MAACTDAVNRSKVSRLVLGGLRTPHAPPCMWMCSVCPPGMLFCGWAVNENVCGNWMSLLPQTASYSMRLQTSADLQADLGIVVDTDVDRSAVVGSNGEAVAGNRYIALMASIVLRCSLFSLELLKQVYQPPGHISAVLPDVACCRPGCSSLVVT